MTDATDELLHRVRRIEDRQRIEDLLTRYAIACDDRDFTTLGECFTPDAVFVSVGGTVEGRAALVEYFRERLGQSGPTYHVPHRLVLDELGDDSARGTLLAHSEMMFDDGFFVAGHRYHDVYRCVEGTWLVAERRLEFLYGMPLRDLLDLDPAEPRKRWPGTTPQPAEIPEGLETWHASRELRRSRP